LKRTKIEIAILNSKKVVDSS